MPVSAAAPNTQTGDDGAAGCGGGYVKGTQQESDVTPTVQNFGYSGGVQKYEVKASGTYRLEVWGHREDKQEVMGHGWHMEDMVDMQKVR